MVTEEPGHVVRCSHDLATVYEEFGFDLGTFERG